MQVTIHLGFAGHLVSWRRVVTLLCLIALTACTPVQPATPPSTTSIVPEPIDVNLKNDTTNVTVSPTPVPLLTDLAVAQMLFAEQPLPLGELEATFRQQLADGYFQDYTRQDRDVNGDGQPEILISGHISLWYLYFAILGYSEQGWQEWLYTTADTKYCGDVRPTVTAELMTVDFLTCSGGTGVFDLLWEQRWVQCGAESCAVVWSAPLVRTERVVAWQTARTYQVATVERPDPATIRLTTQRFGVSVYPYPDTSPYQPGTAQRSQGPTTVDSYHWDGERYVWQSREEQTPGITIQDQFDLMTQETYDLVWQQIYKDFEKQDGQMDGEGLERALTDFWQLPPADAASGWAAPHRRLAAAAHTGTPQALGEWVAGLVGTAEPFVCQLSLHRQTNEQLAPVAQQTVPCTRNFSHLAWADLTGDGQAELLLLTIPPADEADTNVETSAGMQRLHIYTVDNQLTELAVVDGYVNGPDGEGVRWRVGNATGAQPEVWAGLPLAPLSDPIGWPDRTRRFQIYRWDAEQQKLVAAEVQNETGTERAQFPFCVAPAALAETIGQQANVTPDVVAAAVIALTGSSRTLFDVEVICVIFGGGSGLWRLNLASGEVTSVLSASWDLAISPDETLVAYTGAVLDELSLRNLATGETRGIKLPMLEGETQLGSIVWSPDSQRLAITVAYEPCVLPEWSQSIVVVDVQTRTIRTLIEKDKRLFVAQTWLDEKRIQVGVQEGKTWEVDVATGTLVTGEEGLFQMERTQIRKPSFESSCPVTQPDAHFWRGTGPVAGFFPVWVTTYGEEDWSMLWRDVLPPGGVKLGFERGKLSGKRLVFIDQGVQDDLQITGKEWKSNDSVYFPSREILTTLDDQTNQLTETPPTTLHIPDATTLDRTQNPPGKATRGWGFLLPHPGCYEFTFTIAEHTMPIVMEFVEPAVLAQRQAARAAAIEQIRAFANDPKLQVNFVGVSTSSYAPVATYLFTTTWELYEVDANTHEVVGFGPRSLGPGETPPTYDLTPRYTPAELEAMARKLIATHSPTIDLTQLAPQHANKEQTAFFFRWEDTAHRVEWVHPFVQVGLTRGGALISYANTVALTRPFVEGGNDEDHK